MIGLELNRLRARAVIVGPDGRVAARRTTDAGGNLSAAASASIAAVRADVRRHEPVAGLASPTPDAPEIAAAAAALAGELPGPQAVLPSGAAAALAESWIGAARGLDEIVLLTVGDHVLGGIIRDGRIVSGSRGRAGSVAWLALNPVEREDYRKIGCVEAEIASAGIVRRLVWRVKAGDESQVERAAQGDLGAITVERVLEAGRAGDGVAISVIRDTAKYLGMAAANLVALNDPAALVLGGIVAAAPDLLLEPVRAEITRRLPRSMVEGLRIAIAALGDDGPAIGAARASAAPP